MLGIKQNFILFCFCIVTLLTGVVYPASEPEEPALSSPKGLEDVWDPARYIGLDEIKPGMEAYCLTEYGVDGIEKFGMEVIDVVHNINPGTSPGSRDAILVKGTDQRFIHTGPVAGCSGSPVYIDGRLAGALAFTWTYSKDPLYGATPIAEMLAVGSSGMDSASARQPGLALDYTVPIDFAEIEKQFRDHLFQAGSSSSGTNFLPNPFVTSGLSAGVCRQLSETLEPLGFMVVGGSALTGSDIVLGTTEEKSKKARLQPGAYIGVPFVSGDITMSTYGTVTEVVDDKVYAFGHFLLGYGQVDLPMAAAKVHTVVSSVASSFKLASLTEMVGALRTDEAAGVTGRIGLTAKTIPLTIRIDRYNDSRPRLYNCRLVHNRVLSPFYLRMALAGAALQHGDLPPEHMVEYKVDISLEDSEPIAFENVSSGMGLNDVISECYSAVGMLMNNPYQRVDIESVDCQISMASESIISHIWSVDLSDTQVKAGAEIEITAVLESVLAGKKQYQFRMDIPENLAPGKYKLTICGQRDYEQFIAKAAGHKFVAQSLPGLIEALNHSLQIDRDKLYCLLSLPPGGVIIEKAELPDLPATKALLLADNKRTLRVRPYTHWLEKNLDIDSIVIDKKVLQITVEE